MEFDSAGQILSHLGPPQNGAHYPRLAAAFRRVFRSSVFFGTEEKSGTRKVWDCSRVHFFERMRLWFRHGDMATGSRGNMLTVSESFWEEQGQLGVQNHGRDRKLRERLRRRLMLVSCIGRNVQPRFHETASISNLVLLEHYIRPKQAVNKIPGVASRQTINEKLATGKMSTNNGKHRKDLRSSTVSKLVVGGYFFIQCPNITPLLPIIVVDSILQLGYTPIP